MDIAYQGQLLSYLVQEKDGGNYIDGLTEDTFDLIEYQLTLQVLKKYYRLYESLPSAVTARQFLEEQIKQTPDLTKEVVKDLREVMEDIYVPLPTGDLDKVRDTIILQIQDSTIEKTFMDFASGKASSTQVFTRMNKLSSLVKSAGDDLFKEGSFLIQERNKHSDEKTQGNPTFLDDLNDMTAAGGFYSPQLIVFLSGPKHFKTGIILKIVIEYARGGNRVYYADNENGARQIRNRAKMAIMECELHELFEPSLQEELENTLYRFGKYMGGDLYIDSYPAHSKSITDVRNRLAYLKERYKWVPDIIVYDTIDKFIPSNLVDQKRDTRIKIQLVYDEAINLNKELETFAITPSQVNRQAIGKKVFDIKDLSEDFAKSMNAHSVWAVCATPEEEEQGIRRIIPVAQREGIKYGGKNICVVKVDEATMKVEEINREKYLENIDDK